MYRKLNNHKGMSLITVIIIITVLVILGAVFIEAALINLKDSKTNGYIDYSYFAAHAGLAKAFDQIKEKIDTTTTYYTGGASSGTPSVVNDVADTSQISAFVSDVVKTLEKSVFTQTYTDPSAVTKNYTEYLNVSLNNGNSANVRSILEGAVEYKLDPTTKKTVDITIGITAESTFNKSPYTSGPKRTYGRKTFTVNLTLGSSFDLLGPVYSIGDLFAQGNKTNLNISGDARVYGTSPDKLLQPEQYYYGGIMTKTGATMTIDGNAYARSFIRNGLYDGSPDNSRIDITKDAVAQCLQIFGKGDKIIVHRNAYTFDDLEVDGENSVLAVNGSFFGLCMGENTHDDSSAIVNAAPVHFASSADSLKSRIVVNGAVMLNGGTYRIKPDSGVAMYQIEDASLYWMKDESADPLYNYNGPLYKLVDDIAPIAKYKDWRNAYQAAHIDAKVWGFGNLFQVWNPKDPTGIAGWVNNIDTARHALADPVSQPEAGLKNDISAFDNSSPIATIKGYCGFEMAANDSIYDMDRDHELLTQVKNATDDFLSSSATYPFKIANVDYKNINPAFNSWGDFWSTSGWSGYNHTLTGIRHKLMQLYDQLVEIPQDFYTRNSYQTYMDSGIEKRKLVNSDNTISHTDNNKFKPLVKRIYDLAPNPYVIKVGTSDDVTTDFKSYLTGKGWSDTGSAAGYYVLVNEYPDKTIKITNMTFNGIILTAGRVELNSVSGDVIINGAIIAAGRGFEYKTTGSEPVAGKSAADGSQYLPRVSDTGIGINQLNNGDFAAIYCTGNDASTTSSSVAHDIQINFPPDPGGDPENAAGRRDALLSKFQSQPLGSVPELLYIFKK